MPPAAITGISTASTICGTSTIVVSSPICPPASHPSAITASTPLLSILFARATDATDRKSTRLNSSHANISYAVFCLKKKNEQRQILQDNRYAALQIYYDVDTL